MLPCRGPQSSFVRVSVGHVEQDNIYLRKRALTIENVRFHRDLYCSSHLNFIENARGRRGRGGYRRLYTLSYSGCGGQITPVV